MEYLTILNVSVVAVVLFVVAFVVAARHNKKLKALEDKLFTHTDVISLIDTQVAALAVKLEAATDATVSDVKKYENSMDSITKKVEDIFNTDDDSVTVTSTGNVTITTAQPVVITDTAPVVPSAVILPSDVVTPTPVVADVAPVVDTPTVVKTETEQK